MEQTIYKTPEHKRRYALKNKEKVIAASSAWNKANKDRVNEAAKRFYDKIKNDPDFKKKNAEKTKEWARKNPHKVLEQSARKRATKLQRMPSWLTKNQKDEIKSFYKKAKDLTENIGIKYHVDHIVPLRGKTVSGLHVPWNLNVIPSEENMKKSNKLLPELIAR